MALGPMFLRPSEKAQWQFYRFFIMLVELLIRYEKINRTNLFAKFAQFSSKIQIWAQRL